MATVQDALERSLRLIGQLAEGEEPSDDTLADAMEAFNTMLDSWSAERLSVFSTQDQTFTWGANVSSRTLGPSGDFVGERPVQVDDSTYFIQSNLSYTINLINEAQYNAIPQKTDTSTWPQVMFVNYTMPNIEMKVYPVPTASLAMHIISVNILTEASALSDTLVLPQGYKRAFEYNLGCEIASEFGIEAPERVTRLADVSKKVIKRINQTKDVMSMPIQILTPNSGRFNPYTGLPM